MDPSLDRCSCHSFGLLKCGCGCVRSQWREEHSHMVPKAEDNLFKVSWNITTNHLVHTTDGICRLWNYVVSTSLWGFCAVIILFASLPAYVTLDYLTFTPGIHFWSFFGTYYFLILEDKTEPFGDIFSLSTVLPFRQPGMHWNTRSYSSLFLSAFIYWGFMLLCFFPHMSWNPYRGQFLWLFYFSLFPSSEENKVA